MGSLSDRVLMGLDVGQKRSPTALCVAQSDDRGGQRRTVYHYSVRHLERLALGTSYPEVAERVAQVARALRRKTGQGAQLYVNATGLGQPLVDLLCDEASDLRQILPVYFNHGDQRTLEGGSLRLGKAYLVSRLQMLLQSRRLHLPRTNESEQLATELLEYEIEIEPDANDRYGAFRVGTRDDLVTALGLAVHHDPIGPGIY
ncbi:MAG: hypothetical protein MPN21_27475 [Thermoanaerobaculia bacterium]|nr:hypothetical protein [Thermoanaerobaculia bacterium]